MTIRPSLREHYISPYHNAGYNYARTCMAEEAEHSENELVLLLESVVKHSS